jgi:hypothetical protein
MDIPGTSIDDVVAQILEYKPELDVKALTKIAFLVAGEYAALTARPLFFELIEKGADGPVIQGLSLEPRESDVILDVLAIGCVGAAAIGHYDESSPESKVERFYRDPAWRLVPGGDPLIETEQLIRVYRDKMGTGTVPAAVLDAIFYQGTEGT